MLSPEDCNTSAVKQSWGPMPPLERSISLIHLNSNPRYISIERNSPRHSLSPASRRGLKDCFHNRRSIASNWKITVIALVAAIDEITDRCHPSIAILRSPFSSVRLRQGKTKWECLSVLIVYIHAGYSQVLSNPNWYPTKSVLEPIGSSLLTRGGGVMAAAPQSCVSVLEQTRAAPRTKRTNRKKPRTIVCTGIMVLVLVRVARHLLSRRTSNFKMAA